MEDFLGKVITAGIELQNKAIDVVEDLVKRGKLDPEEMSRFLEVIHKNIDEYKGKSEKITQEMLCKMGQSVPFATKVELENLKKEVDQLRKQLEKKAKSGKTAKASGKSSEKK
ncbi:MAG: hypothetical protein ACE5GM_00835 [bacterium]